MCNSANTTTTTINTIHPSKDKKVQPKEILINNNVNKILSNNILSEETL